MMKTIYKKIFIYVLSLFFLASNISISVNANPVVTTVASEILKTAGYSALGTGVASIVSHLVDSWLGVGKNYYDSPGTNTRNDYYTESSNFGTITNSGADNENCWNSYSSTVTDNRTYSLVKNIDNSLDIYCPITNTYQEINNITYNQKYDTYYIENNEYNYYVTNNYTYVSYYIINNETKQEDYYEIYYEMPDGRNSYDLRAYEVWGEYFIYDLVGYDFVKEDDGKTLALYHLDGNGKDSSCWNNSDMSLGRGNFVEGKFGNGLFLNSGDEVFLNFPKGFDINNFTIEFTFITPSTFDGCKSFGCYVYLVDNINLTNEIFTSKYSDNPYFLQYYDYDAFNLGPLSSGYGVYNVVIQRDNGIGSFYINGLKKDFTSFKNWSLECDFSVYSIEEFERIYIQKKLPILFNKGNSFRFSAYSGGVDYLEKYILDEIRISNCALYEGDYISVMSQPFDTNQVLVTPTYFHENMIAVQGTKEVSDFRIGGVRPTYPTDGYVYVYLEDDIVKDIQQYQGDGWYSVNACIRKGGKWIDLKDYDLSVVTMGGENNDGENTDGENTGGNGSVSDNETDIGYGDSDNKFGLDDLLKGMGGFFDGIMSILGKLLGYIGKAIDLLTDIISKVIDIIPKNITNLLSALFPFIPQEWLVAIELSLVCTIILGIVRFLKR